MTALDVYLHHDRVGRLERLSQARLRFAYEPEWVEREGVPLSLGLPGRLEPFGDDECRPFFSGLLPEGGFLRAVARAHHVSAGNAFALLAEVGGECAGAVSLAAPGAEPPFRSARSPVWLDEDELEGLMRDLPSRPLLFGHDDEDEGLRLSLAGAQDKLPVLDRGGRIGITYGQPPSTHIIKTSGADLPAMVANEAFCLVLARSVGLGAAEARPLRVGWQEGLLVTRYDRTQDGDEIRRIHQEDFCQALRYLPEQKYEADGGPGVRACATLIRDRSAAPAADLWVFHDALIFNYLIGNADAHAKNFSFLLEGGRSPRMTPQYDLLSTRAYGGRFGRKMAMKLGGEYRFDRIRRRHIERLADDLGISARRARTRAHELAGRVLAAAELVRSELPIDERGEGMVDRVVEIVGEHSRRLWDALEEPG